MTVGHHGISSQLYTSIALQYFIIVGTRRGQMGSHRLPVREITSKLSTGIGDNDVSYIDNDYPEE